MPDFDVAVTWSMSGTYRVKGVKNLDEAKRKILDSEKPYDKLPKGTYIDESIQIDNDLTNDLNN